MKPALLPPSPPVGALLDGRLETIRRMDAKRGQAAAVRELEVVFFTQLLQAMRRTLPENSLLPRSPSRDVYDGLFDRELANVLAEDDPLGLVSRLGGDDGEDQPLAPSDPRPEVTREETARTVPARTVPPVNGVLASPYGIRRDPVTGRRLMHQGVDLAAPADTPISAVAAGRVVASGQAGPAGYRVVIDHGDGYRSVYAHAKRTLAEVNDTVVAGQVIATVGSSGRATGPHLHFEVHRNGVPLDPARAALTSDAMSRAISGEEI